MKVELRDLLKNKAGLKSVDLARALGVNKGTVSRWASGGVPPERVAEVARVTGLSPSEIRPDLADIFAGSSC